MGCSLLRAQKQGMALLPSMFLVFAQANSDIYLSFLYFLEDHSMKYCEVDPVLC